MTGQERIFGHLATGAIVELLQKLLRDVAIRTAIDRGPALPMFRIELLDDLGRLLVRARRNAAQSEIDVSPHRLPQMPPIDDRYGRLNDLIGTVEAAVLEIDRQLKLTPRIFALFGNLDPAVVKRRFSSC